MKATVWIRIEAEGSEARRLHDVVNGLLDGGTPQDQINESGDLRVTSATVSSEPQPSAARDDRRVTDATPRGERNGNAQLTDDQRAQAIRMRGAGATFVEIGRHFGVSESAIRRLPHAQRGSR